MHLKFAQQLEEGRTAESVWVPVPVPVPVPVVQEVSVALAEVAAVAVAAAVEAVAAWVPWLPRKMVLVLVLADELVPEGL